MTAQAMASYLNLAGNEISNGARLAAYVKNGLVPSGFEVRCKGCEGLEDILPCIDEEHTPATGGYQLPETDPSPWYDPLVEHSKNFAGLLVTNVTMSAPFSRTVTQNVGNGQTLGRLNLKGRTIVVTGWLIGKTCCSVQYGLQWLTTALSDPPCAGGDCGGNDLSFLSCCPSLTGEDECLTTNDGQIFIRPAGETEYQRAESFFRTMHGAGIIDGPNVLDCKGNSCGCGCGQILQVEFTLATSSPYLNGLAEDILPVTPKPACAEDDPCDIEWVTDDTCGPNDPLCATLPDCLEDPLCPPPALPPKAGLILPKGCACEPLASSKVCSPVIPLEQWASAALNFEVYAGSKPLRNLKIQVWQNPQQRDCGDPEFFADCDACATLNVSYVPAGGTLMFSGEERTVTVTCNNQTRSAASTVSGLDGAPISWPVLSCVPMCACVSFDCSSADDATVRLEIVGQYL